MAEVLHVLSRDARMWASVSHVGFTFLGTAGNSALFAQMILTGVGENSYQLKQTGVYDVCITFAPCDYFYERDMTAEIVVSVAGRQQVLSFPALSPGKYHERSVQFTFTGEQWDVLKTFVAFCGNGDAEIADVYTTDIRYRGPK